MSASVYVSFLIQADNKHEARVQRHNDGVDAAVVIDTNDRNVIQSADPEALRVLAAVLVEAADKADALLGDDEVLSS